MQKFNILEFGRRLNLLTVRDVRLALLVFTICCLANVSCVCVRVQCVPWLDVLVARKIVWPKSAGIPK